MNSSHLLDVRTPFVRDFRALDKARLCSFLFLVVRTFCLLVGILLHSTIATIVTTTNKRCKRRHIPMNAAGIAAYSFIA